jgi:S-DNA-T family DNA segregation ATPase FtsK/SpoIIIE
MPAKSNRRAPSRRRPSARDKPARPKVRQHLAPWARDALGIGLMVFALISILGLWFDAAGFVGRGIELVLEALVGQAAVLFPPIALYWGVLLLRGTAEDVRARMFIGFAFMSVALLALWSLTHGNPAPFSGTASARDAAGFVGAATAWPISRGVSRLGAGIIWAGVTVLGVLIFTGTPLSAAWARVRELSAAAVDEETEPGRARRTKRDRRDRTEEDVPVVVDLRDQEAEPEPASPPSGTESNTTFVPTSAPKGGAYKLPPIDLLRTAPASAGSSRDEEQTTAALERTFRTFGVAARVPKAHRGPTVTLFEVEVEAGTKVNKVLSLADDIAYALATPDVRIIAPIPGRSAIGVEVPNRVRDFVMLGDVLRARAAKEDRHPLAVALGKDVHGRAQMVNLTKMPHLLIAGATGGSPPSSTASSRPS